MSERGDRNGGPWIVEDIAKGPCVYACQFRLLVLCRRLGLKRMSQVESQTGTFTNSSNETFMWCKSVSQGMRDYQEDRSIIAEPMVFKSSRSRGRQDEYFLFSVFDGHGRPSQGHKVSDFCEQHFSVYLNKELENLSAQSLSNHDGVTDFRSSQQNSIRTTGRSFRIEKINSGSSITGERRDIEEPFFAAAFERTCKTVDNAVRRRFPTVAMQNGSTATCLMLGSSKAVFANLGDSRGAQFVVRSEDMPGTVVFATHDHKPSRFDEANRIAKAGGWVEANRVNGDLAVSRTIGDLEYKPYGSPTRLCPVSIKPSVDVIDREKGMKELYIVASDGLWDGISTADACQFVVDHMRKAKNKALQKGHYCEIDALQASVEKLISFVFKRRLSTDNITVVVIMPVDEENHNPQTGSSSSRDKDPCSTTHTTSAPQVEPEQSPATGIPSTDRRSDEEVKESLGTEGLEVRDPSTTSTPPAAMTSA